jgi:hypothetical protein
MHKGRLGRAQRQVRKGAKEVQGNAQSRLGRAKRGQVKKYTKAGKERHKGRQGKRSTSACKERQKGWQEKAHVNARKSTNVRGAGKA